MSRVNLPVEQEGLPVQGGRGHGGHSENVPRPVLESDAGTAPGGSNVARARAPSASRHARSGELRHSTGTRSELRVCLKTHGMPSGRSTRTVLLDTPPRRTDRRTPLPVGMPCASRYARNWLA